MRAALFLISVLHSCCALRLNGNPPVVTHDGPVYVYVPIGKTGSSSFREFMMQRNRARGWRDDNAVDQWGDDNAPSGFMWQDNWGTCSALKDNRPCTYIVTLREPVSRMVSAYNYWCKDCTEDRKYCGGVFQPATCPDMSIVEFTRRYGNHYTRKFRGDAAPNDWLDGGDWFTQHGLTDGGFIRDLTEDDLKIAIKHVTSDVVFALATEDTRKLDKLATHLNETWGQDFPHENAHSHHYEPTEEERQTMESFLSYDKQLYEALFATAVTAKTIKKSVVSDDAEVDDWANAAA